MARSKEEKRVQLSVGVEEALKTQLKKAAKMSARSLSGEILFRLRSSFDQQSDTAAA